MASPGQGVLPGGIQLHQLSLVAVDPGHILPIPQHKGVHPVKILHGDAVQAVALPDPGGHILGTGAAVKGQTVPLGQAAVCIGAGQKNGQNAYCVSSTCMP